MPLPAKTRTRLRLARRESAAGATHRGARRRLSRAAPALTVRAARRPPGESRRFLRPIPRTRGAASSSGSSTPSRTGPATRSRCSSRSRRLSRAARALHNLAVLHARRAGRTGPGRAGNGDPARTRTMRRRNENLGDIYSKMARRPTTERCSSTNRALGPDQAQADREPAQEPGTPVKPVARFPAQ